MIERHEFLNGCQLTGAFHRDGMKRPLAAKRQNIVGETMGFIEQDECERLDVRRGNALLIGQRVTWRKDQQ